MKHIIHGSLDWRWAPTWHYIETENSIHLSIEDEFQLNIEAENSMALSTEDNHLQLDIETENLIRDMSPASAEIWTT